VDALNNALFERRQKSQPQGVGLSFAPGFLQRLQLPRPSGETQL
jgi:hypothetical protein